MACVAAVIATIDSVGWPVGFSPRNGLSARVLNAKVDLVPKVRHVGTAVSCVMDFMIAVGLSVLVYDESWHCPPLSEGF